MTMKNDTKTEEELTCQFKTDIRNLTNFDPSTRKSKNVHFHGLLLTKLYNVWAKKVKRSYVWLHSRLIQSLKENWFVFPKTDMRNLANFHQSIFKSLKIGTSRDPFIRSKKCMSLKFRGEFCVIAMKNGAKFKEELTCQFKMNDFDKTFVLAFYNSFLKIESNCDKENMFISNTCSF